MPSGKTYTRQPVLQLTEDAQAIAISGLLIIAVLVMAFSTENFVFRTPVYQWGNWEELLQKVFATGNLLLLALIGLVFMLLSSLAVFLSGGRTSHYIRGFVCIYLMAVASLVIAGNKAISYYGIEYVVVALVAGLLLSNVITTLPAWLRAAARSEFFIKTGLVILGTSILFTDIVRAGLPGILQALIVVAVVWFFAMWLCRKLKVDDEFAVILASAVSICGVSAAIVASGAIGGDKRKLSYVTTLVLVIAIPMMILQPWIIHWWHIPEVVGGAWLGGTLDTTASVTAASQLVGPVAVKTGVIVKFSQNVLIGVAAFFIAAWWVFRKKGAVAGNKEKPGLGIVWRRFPKFVLAFIAASLVFSFLVPAATAKEVGGFLNSLRTIWFALAFVAIGLEAIFADLVRLQNGRPAIAFIGAQLFNILVTLLLAWLLFGGLLLPPPAIA
ncbi:MAG: putative sulfate exporter family transporter [Chitinophagaceae bacterium]